MRNFIKRLCRGVDTYAFNTTAIIICAISAFIGMAVGFAGLWYGWLHLAFCIVGAIFFIRDLNRVERIIESQKEN